MYNPWEDDVKVCWCSHCGKEIDEIVYLNSFGDPYCVDCMVDERETDEDGEFLDDDWETMSAYDYATEEEAQNYLAYCDKRYDEMRELGYC